MHWFFVSSGADVLSLVIFSLIQLGVPQALACCCYLGYEYMLGDTDTEVC